MAETLKIKDLPIDSRPREAFMRAADPVREIPDSMLLAILIRTGQKGSSAIDIANRLIKYFGSTEKLVEASWQQILNAKVSGVGKVAAVQLAAAFALVRRTVRMSHRAYSRSVESPEDVVRQLRSVGADLTQECVFALYLDKQRHLLCEPSIVLKGTVDRTLIHPREIYRRAISLGAVSLIVAHNHPGGDPIPSEDDIEQTRRLVSTGRCVGIPLDDHIVVAGEKWMSMRNEELVDFNRCEDLYRRG